MLTLVREIKFHWSEILFNAPSSYNGTSIVNIVQNVCTGNVNN